MHIPWLDLILTTAAQVSRHEMARWGKKKEDTAGGSGERRERGMRPEGTPLYAGVLIRVPVSPLPYLPTYNSQTDRRNPITSRVMLKHLSCLDA